jgi:hypothetical protein
MQVELASDEWCDRIYRPTLERMSQELQKVASDRAMFHCSGLMFESEYVMDYIQSQSKLQFMRSTDEYVKYRLLASHAPC